MLEVTAFLGDIVTVLGFPLGILAFWIQRNRERRNEEAMIYESLASSYDGFLKLVLENTDLQLWSKDGADNLDADQQERLQVLFELLGSLFERAYILAYSDHMTEVQQRRWSQWENYMRQWCGREDFSKVIPQLLADADHDFARYLRRLADEERVKKGTQP
ncbi:hypothetical protein [Devosia sediminis]|uniref:DUF4760 domain-containing protein n=1 Tax=Devosia sediminis TaxID=2798801 RepID=A0A934J172_9HYPH|nr:hypothetical protein [Devosia sediminis]MBJ3786388.1 hypothetical protein [Devosia sediminis]